jgi:uncharacterized protein YbjT (DUF2867 family)
MGNQKRPVLVLGGTGHLGSSIVGTLLEMHQPVRVLTRSVPRARQVLGDGPTFLECDLAERSAVAEVAVANALEGAEAVVVCLSAFSPKLIRQMRAIERDAVLMVFDQARQAGVIRVVYISTYDIRPDVIAGMDFPIAQIKLEVETVLKGSDLAWTVLGAAPSMDIFFAMIRGERMVVPGGGPPVLPTIARADVGQIAAQTALRADLAGRRIRMVGPQAMSFPEAAERISAVWGRVIRFQRMPFLPLQLASIVSRPFYPYLRHLAASVQLMNNFPRDIVAQVEEDHRWLIHTFDYAPTTLETEALRRMAS